MDPTQLTADIRAGHSYAQLKEKHHITSETIANHKRNVMGMKLRRQVRGRARISAMDFDTLLQCLCQQMRREDISRVVLHDTGAAEIHKAKRLNVLA